MMFGIQKKMNKNEICLINKTIFHTKMTTNIYVLRLKGGKYYVGKSDNVLKRYKEHKDGKGSSWTKKHIPVGIEKVIENVSPFEEDKITKEYMDKYGIDNVRGGSYTNIELDETQKNNIQTEIWGAKDLCSNCGRSGHFIKDCHAKTDVNGDYLIDVIDELEVDDDDKVVMGEECVEWGCEYCNRSFTTKFGCIVHEKSCKPKQRSSYYKEDECEVIYHQPKTNYVSTSYTYVSNQPITCYRCGRKGHYATNCYASTHVSSYRR